MSLYDKVREAFIEEQLDDNTEDCLRMVLGQKKGKYHIRNKILSYTDRVCVNPNYCPLKRKSLLNHCQIERYNKEADEAVK